MGSNKTNMEAAQSDVLHLHPHPTITLVLHNDQGIKTKRLAVSREILTAASPYFKALFDSGFAEGRKVASSRHAEIGLHQDDADIMTMMLSVLHYVYNDSYFHLSPIKLALLAMHSDKYMCTDALRPWFPNWFHDSRRYKNPDEFFHLMTAAYFFKSSGQFNTASRNAIRNITPEFESTWASLPIISSLPPQVIEKLSDRADVLNLTMLESIHQTERELRSYAAQYGTERSVCGYCFKETHDAECGTRAGSYEYRLSKPCTMEHRILDFFRILEKAELWPLVRPFRELPVEELIIRFAGAKNNNGHVCEGGPKCPLIERLAKLYDDSIVASAGIEGLDLADFRGRDISSKKVNRVY